MDTKRSLWLVRGVFDVDAYRENTFALSATSDLSAFRTCEPFLAAFPSVFVALADRELARTVAEALEEYAPSVIVLMPREAPLETTQISARFWTLEGKRPSLA